MGDPGISPAGTTALKQILWIRDNIDYEKYLLNGDPARKIGAPLSDEIIGIIKDPEKGWPAALDLLLYTFNSNRNDVLLTASLFGIKVDQKNPKLKARQLSETILNEPSGSSDLSKAIKMVEKSRISGMGKAYLIQILYIRDNIDYEKFLLYGDPKKGAAPPLSRETIAAIKDPEKGWPAALGALVDLFHRNPKDIIQAAQLFNIKVDDKNPRLKARQISESPNGLNVKNDSTDLKAALCRVDHDECAGIPDDDIFTEAARLLGQERYQQAIETFNKLPKKKLLTFAAQYNLGFCYKEIGKKAEAISAFKLAQKLARSSKPPVDPNLLRGLADQIASLEKEPPAAPAASQPAIDLEAARDYFEKGSQAFQRGDYKNAAVYFRKAYGITKDPLLFYNIAQSKQRLGQKIEAVYYYSGYLIGVPDAEDRDQVKHIIREIENDEEMVLAAQATAYMRAAEQSSDPKKIEQHYRSALVVFSLIDESKRTDPSILYRMAACYQSISDFKLALEYYQKGDSLGDEWSRSRAESAESIRLCKLGFSSAAPASAPKPEPAQPPIVFKPEIVKRSPARSSDHNMAMIFLAKNHVKKGLYAKAEKNLGQIDHTRLAEKEKAVVERLTTIINQKKEAAEAKKKPAAQKGKVQEMDFTKEEAGSGKPDSMPAPVPKPAQKPGKKETSPENAQLLARALAVAGDLEKKGDLKSLITARDTYKTVMKLNPDDINNRIAALEKKIEATNLMKAELFRAKQLEQKGNLGEAKDIYSRYAEQNKELHERIRSIDKQIDEREKAANKKTKINSAKVAETKEEPGIPNAEFLKQFSVLRKSVDELHKKATDKGKTLVGTVVFRIGVRPDGSVENVELAENESKLPADFINQAIAAMKKWKFTKADRRTVADLPFNFKVQGVNAAATTSADNTTLLNNIRSAFSRGDLAEAEKNLAAITPAKLNVQALADYNKYKFGIGKWKTAAEIEADKEVNWLDARAAYDKKELFEIEPKYFRKKFKALDEKIKTMTPEQKQASLPNLKEAVKKEPKNPALQNKLGWALIRNGIFIDALSAFNASVSSPGPLGKDNPDNHYGRAIALNHLNKCDLAKAAYKDALDVEYFSTLGKKDTYKNKPQPWLQSSCKK